ncbi:MAG: hypothetical protein MJY83_02890 [Bacteroidales bacterium]|nr:hypothetical protein [Bacteroidales bacterium]
MITINPAEGRTGATCRAAKAGHRGELPLQVVDDSLDLVGVPQHLDTDRDKISTTQPRGAAQ